MAHLHFILLLKQLKLAIWKCITQSYVNTMLSIVEGTRTLSHSLKGCQYFLEFAFGHYKQKKKTHIFMSTMPALQCLAHNEQEWMTHGLSCHFLTVWSSLIFFSSQCCYERYMRSCVQGTLHTVAVTNGRFSYYC